MLRAAYAVGQPGDRAGRDPAPGRRRHRAGFLQGARTRVAKIDVTIAARRIGVANPSAINGYDLDAVHGARLLVEGATVRDAALRMSKADIGRLRDSPSRCSVPRRTTRSAS